MRYNYTIARSSSGFITFKFDSEVIGIECMLEDMESFKEAIFLPYFNKVLNHQSQEEQIGGNICSLRIGPDTTNIRLEFVANGMQDEYQVDTKALRNIIIDWIERNSDILEDSDQG